MKIFNIGRYEVDDRCEFDIPSIVLDDFTAHFRKQDFDQNALYNALGVEWRKDTQLMELVNILREDYNNRLIYGACICDEAEENYAIFAIQNHITGKITFYDWEIYSDSPDFPSYLYDLEREEWRKAWIFE